MPEPVRIHQGKVRDVYRWEDRILLVASDRISAFDVILPTTIPGKGAILTQLSRFWFDRFQNRVPHHVIGYELPEEIMPNAWHHRLTVCRQAKTVPMECVVRGYLSGSGWKDYQQSGRIQGLTLPAGLVESERLPEPLFTPTTKAAAGHDQPLTETEARNLVGDELYHTLRDRSLALYQDAHAYAIERGIIIADTKFEFGHTPEGELLLIDECLTPDSSRFWPLLNYQPGRSQPSFDKQFVRDYLLTLKDWNQQPPGPDLPREIVSGTQAKYREAFAILTGRPLDFSANG
ncbi:MAG: phosphoribosylaminoimidazolesuccinocarboxamide synthase [Candidatus Methylacidiphilales bacterium]|nr:phosphoribosylaminoimidazolesuccinocarboxamide synthase [Candidatus Methylacidiphilales bacterium]